MSKYKIIAPVKKTCDGYGLHFVDGIAGTDDDTRAEYLKNRGYEVELSEAAVEDAKKAEKEATKAAKAAKKAAEASSEPTTSPDI